MIKFTDMTRHTTLENLGISEIYEATGKVNDQTINCFGY